MNMRVQKGLKKSTTTIIAISGVCVGEASQNQERSKITSCLGNVYLDNPQFSTLNHPSFKGMTVQETIKETKK